MTASDLTSLANVKAWLGKTDTTSDAILALLITEKSAEIRTYTSRDIYPVISYTDVSDGNERSVKTLPNFPITAVSNVTIDSLTIPVSTNQGAGYLFDKNSIRLNGYRFTKGVQNVSVTYSAGYAAIPADIERACIEWVAFAHENRTRIGYASKSMAGETTAFITSSMPASVKETLERWKRAYP